MDRATHCPNCFRAPAPAARCAQCGFDAATYDGESNDLLPLFAALAEGKYRIGRVLGEGGFGVVYAGWVHGLERTVAIKEFFPATDNPLARRQGLTVTARPRYQAEFADWKQQFLREAQLLAQFSHPRIVQVHDILEEHNTIYLIMERLEGQTLSDALGGLEQRGEELAAGHALPPEQAAPLLHAALEALDILHGHAPPVIHRDLTPHNLFLVDGRIDRLKVLDFGLARLGTRTQSIASIAAKVGNPGFAAPEQLGLYPGAIGPATDFYTLGATLYTALTGVAPPNAQQRCDGGRLLPPPPLPPHLDPALAQIIRACLEISPQRRPQSVAEIRQRLAAGTIIPPSEPEPEPEPPPRPEPTPAVTLTPHSPGSRWRRGLILGTVLGAGGLAFALWQAGQSPPPAGSSAPAAPSSPVVNPPPPVEPRAYLTVRATPASAQIRIMNIGPAYRDGIELIPGDFDIEVSAPGYQTSRAWYTLAAGAREIAVVLPANSVAGMTRITGGCFQMGSPESEEGRDGDEQPHRVCVNDFEIGQREVTVGAFRRFVEATNYRTDAEKSEKGCYAWSDSKWQLKADLNWRNPGFKQSDDHPVVCVSGNDALAYTDWLSEQTGQPYRLPTEAEWEYAARAGTSTAYWWGDDIGRNRANCNGCGSRWDNRQTAPVGSFDPNPWKLYDTAGNVWEWTCSLYHEKYDGAETKCTTKDTIGPRSFRGGSWGDGPVGVRSAGRFWNTPTNRNDTTGFRLARSL
ncbi:MAG TPA: bifunctional serine/threonine-protein kinase/formylglycine-generating enzyme family protein [Candidatus Competibacter sp.]|nr:bifunctional serine/threonine-protein kinase/formylglycine-generating enzyme family protein [Candidatus Competibacter sp.]